MQIWPLRINARWNCDFNGKSWCVPTVNMRNMHFKKDASVKFVIFTVSNQKQTARDAKFSICTVNVTKDPSFNINRIWNVSCTHKPRHFSRWISLSSTCWTPLLPLLTLAVAWRRKLTSQMYLLSINKRVLVCLRLFSKAAATWSSPQFWGLYYERLFLYCLVYHTTMSPSLSACFRRSRMLALLVC